MNLYTTILQMDSSKKRKKKDWRNLFRLFAVTERVVMEVVHSTPVSCAIDDDGPGHKTTRCSFAKCLTGPPICHSCLERAAGQFSVVESLIRWTPNVRTTSNCWSDQLVDNESPFLKMKISRVRNLTEHQTDQCAGLAGIRFTLQYWYYLLLLYHVNWNLILISLLLL